MKIVQEQRLQLKMKSILAYNMKLVFYGGGEGWGGGLIFGGGNKNLVEGCIEGVTGQIIRFLKRIVQKPKTWFKKESLVNKNEHLH